MAGLEDGIINDLELNIRKVFPSHSIIQENSFSMLKKIIKKINILITGFEFTERKGNELIVDVRSIRPDLQIIVILNDYLSASIMFHHNVNAALPNYKNANIIIKHLKLAIMYLDSQIQFENLNPDHKLIINGQIYVCANRPIQEVFMDAAKYALYGKPILIQGESGGGKEHLANYIHLKSKRKGSLRQ
ncbi:MAG: sigma-54 factor interaction domain-containing protein [Bacteroidetes bacterium]|nr:sigma-54 factor interaction domain-containing protein [Bacteroidota bacterium]